MTEPVCIASCTHDLGGTERLFAYTPVPDERIHQGEALAIQTFGIPVRSPVTPYVSIWRSENSLRMDASTPPEQVFLTAIFGSEPWRPPTGLVEQAEQRQRRSELVLGALWNLVSGEPVLERFSVEIRASGGHVTFRSMHGKGDLSDLDIAWGVLHLPANGAESLAFNARVVMPERYNVGEALRGRRVEVTLTGSAVPIPDWVNY